MIEHSVRIGGAFVFWSLAQWTDRQKLLDGLTTLGMEALCPEPRTPLASLKDTLSGVFKDGKFRVESLGKKDGFSVKAVERREDDVQWATDLVARIEPDSLRILFWPHDDRADVVVEQFNRHLGLLSNGQVAGCMVNVLSSLGATPMRPGGGVYWLADARLEDWHRVGQVVEGSAEGRPSCCYTARTLMDNDTMRAVCDALVSEINSEAERLDTEIGSGTLGQRALETRQYQAVELDRKITAYEGYLGRRLDSLHESVENARDAACRAALMIAVAKETVSV